MTQQTAAAVIQYIIEDNTDVKEIFDLYDVNKDGAIHRQELIEVLSVCAHEIGLDVNDHLEQVADIVFSYANLNSTGAITLEALREVLKRHPNLVSELQIAKDHHHRPQIDCELKNLWEAMIDRLSKRMPITHKLRRDYISNNLVRFNFFLALMFISTALFIGRILSYWGSCGWLILARAAGQCLNFFCAIIVLLVCRRTISCLRSKGYGRYLPLDDHVYFHKMIGLFIVGHSLAHSIGHICNFYVVSSESDAKYSWSELLFGVHANIGWIGGCASLTGWFLLIILAVMTLAQPYSRSLGKFELFYYTHLLYIPFWILLFIHAPRFWKWFFIPCAVFFVETLLRLRNLLTNLTSTGQTTIIKAVPLPSDVIHLVIKRPPYFDYNPGDWIYVLIPQIAKYEWHPFTISSAPEQEGVITLHIRAVGEWTRSLRSYFEGLQHRNHLSRFIKSGQFSMSMDNFCTTIDLTMNDSNQQILLTSRGQVKEKINQLRSSVTSLAPIPENKSLGALESVSSNQSQDSLNSTQTTSQRVERFMPNITIFIDGPYGSPSSQIFRAEHAVLIATGIGVTPFASILQSIVHHYEKRRQKCPSCAHEFSDTRPPFVCKLRKVDFVWINRDQKSFEWFIKLLAELELTQSHLSQEERFLDIHIHLTAIEPAQTKSIGLQLALYLVHEKNKKDLVTGLRTRTRAGRPNWDDFFARIQDQKKGKVSVFFCGRPQLGRLLHRQCDSLGFKFRKEIF